MSCNQCPFRAQRLRNDGGLSNEQEYGAVVGISKYTAAGPESFENCPPGQELEHSQVLNEDLVWFLRPHEAALAMLTADRNHSHNRLPVKRPVVQTNLQDVQGQRKK